MRKSYPQFGNFLARLLDGDPTTMGNVIRKVREAEHLPGGKPGKGSPAVDSLGAARVLLSIVGGGGQPYESMIAANWLALCASKNNVEPLPATHGLAEGWSVGNLDRALARIIDARAADETFEGWASTTIRKRIVPDAVVSVRWVPEGWRQCSYSPTAIPEGGVSVSPWLRGMSEDVTMEGWILLAVGDWLAGRDTKRWLEDVEEPA